MSSDHSATLLKGFVNGVLRLRESIAELQTDVREVRKEARLAGFDSTKLLEVVRWLEKVEKHGRPAMEEAEALFDLYRTAVDGTAATFDEMMNDARDRALLKIFAPDDQVSPKINRRVAAVNNAATMARAAKMARGE